MQKSIIASSVAAIMLLNPALVFADGLLPSKEQAIEAQAVKTSETTAEKAAPVVEKTVAITEDEAVSLIKLDKVVIPFHSKLKKKYVGYKVTVISDYPGTLRMQSANITNGFPGASAYSMVETAKSNMWWSALLGLAGIIVIGLPTLAVINSGNHKAENESSQFSNQVPLADLRKGETMSFNALIPMGQTPQIVLSFKDVKTNLFFVKNSL